MTKLEFITQIWRLIKPKFYHRITWYIVSPGLVMVSPPIWSVIINQFIENHTDYKILGDYDVLIGFFLIIVGLIYNVYSQWVNTPKSDKKIIDNSSINVV